MRRKLESPENLESNVSDAGGRNRELTRRDFVRIAGAAGAAAAGGLIPRAVSAAPKPKLSPVTLSCEDATQASITLRVTAGETGAPAGFTVQWETLDQFQKGPDGVPGTPDDNNWTGTQCGGSFSGNASQSRYSLGPFESITINIGDLLFDQGVSTSCPETLECGTAYVFRAFAHATSTLQRSDFSANSGCATLPCDSGDTGGCTFSQGYWKNHNPLVCETDMASPLCIAWPVDSLTLGTTVYNVPQLVSILDTAPKGNGLISLAHQLIAAKLNVANGADPTDALAAIDAADALIGGLVVPPVGSGSLEPAATGALTTELNNYNLGKTGPGHCPE